MRSSSFFVVATLLVASVAQADPASDAKDLFERARQLRAAGKCAEAAPLFEKAASVYPAGLGSVRNAAECEEQLGHFATSHRLWLDLKRAVMLSKDEKYAGWQADAEAAAARLAPRLAHLTVHVTVTDGKVERPLGQTPRVEVKVNGELVAPELLGTQLDRDPGTYVVSVGAEGQPAREQTIDIASGDAKQLTFTVAAPPEATPPEHAAVTVAPRTTTRDEVPPPSNGAATRRTLGWVGVGLGAAALVGAGISLGVRQAALGELRAACPSYETAPCPTGVQPTVDRGATASMLVDVLGIAGGVVLLTGVLVVVLSPQPSRAKETASYAPELSVGLGAVAARWSFQ